MAQARGYFERAFSLDAENIEALVGMGYVDGVAGATFYDSERRGRLEAAEMALSKVLTLAPRHAAAHMWMGLVKSYTNRAEEGIAECERALALDQNLASSHALIGTAKTFVGRGEEMEVHAIEALRLSPRDTFAYAWITLVGAAKVMLGADEEGVAWAGRAAETNPNAPITHFNLAAALAHLGRLQEARLAVEAGLALNPRFTIRGYGAGAQSDNPKYLAQRERMIEGMRKAGVPEG